jgi:hypothetical protein
MSRARVYLAVCVAVIVALVTGGLILAKGSNDPKTPALRNGRCHIGGAPSLDLTRIPPTPGSVPEGEELVIGCQSARWHGPLELVGIDSSQGFCFTADSPRYRDSQGGLCLPRGANWRSICGGQSVCVGNLSWSEVPGHGYAQVVGEMSPRIHRIEVDYGHGREIGRRSLIVTAPLRSRLGQRLHVRGRIALFSIVLPGCPPAKGIKVIGRGPSGAIVASAFSKSVFPHFCSETE